MQKDTLNVGLTCAFGALIGAVTALQFSPNLGWLGVLLGVLLGGIAGYALVEWREVVSAVQRTAKMMLHPDFSGKLAENWIYFSLTLQLTAWVLVALSGFIFWMILPLELKARLDVIQGSSSAHSTWSLFWGTTSIFVFVFLSCAFPIVDERSTLPEKQKEIADVKGWALRINVFCLPVWCVYWSIQGLAWCVVRIPRAASFSFQFVWRVFVLIHSRKRLLCFTDSALGALIGYGFQSPVVGLVAGFCFGVLNYELVSIRLLKLKTA